MSITTITRFRTSDGTEFENVDEANVHEAMLGLRRRYKEWEGAKDEPFMDEDDVLQFISSNRKLIIEFYALDLDYLE